MSEQADNQAPRRRPSLREVVATIDRDILHLLLRRYNVLLRMRGNRGFLAAAEEKQLREAWQKEAERLSPDPKLSSQFFSLMQEVTFRPKPLADGEHGPRRQGFNLAPPRRPVAMRLRLPADAWRSNAWLLLAAASGRPVSIDPCLMHDGQHHFLKALGALGAAVNRIEDAVSVAAGQGLRFGDASLHVGEDIDSFYLLAAQYAVRPSRVRFTGEGALKSADLSSLSRFLPMLGTRLAPVVPRSGGFPVRLECSGMLPEKLAVPAEVPAHFVAALMLALPFAERPCELDFSSHPACGRILDSALPLLRQSGVKLVESASGALQVSPSELDVPEAPVIPADETVAAGLLALPLVLGGEAEFEGHLPDPDDARCPFGFYFRELGLVLRRAGTGRFTVKMAKGLVESAGNALPDALAPMLHGRHAWLAAMIYAVRALCTDGAALPGKADGALGDFFSAAGLYQSADGMLRKKSQVNETVSWNAPSGRWALALAVAACARGALPGFKLGDPGIMTAVWPRFWTVYNALPEPGKIRREENAAAEKKRRRIITGAVAELPPENRDDDE